MPCKHLPKTDLIHRQEMRPLRHGGKMHLQNGCLHDVSKMKIIDTALGFGYMMKPIISTVWYILFGKIWIILYNFASTFI